MRSRLEAAVKHALPMTQNRGAWTGKGRDIGFEAKNRSEQRAKSDARRPSTSPRKSSRASHRARLRRGWSRGLSPTSADH